MLVRLNRKLKKIFLLLLCGVALVERTMADSPSLSVSGAIQKCGDKHCLLFVARNSSGKAIQMIPQQLPWRSSLTTLVAVGVDDPSKVLIRGDMPFDDPGPERLTLGAGEEVSDNLVLEDEIPHLAKVLAKQSVLIFWAAPLSTMDYDTDERAFGGGLIAKNESSARTKTRDRGEKE